jgi:ABC-type sugar transport system, periplasmic component
MKKRFFRLISSLVLFTFLFTVVSCGTAGKNTQTTNALNTTGQAGTDSVKATETTKKSEPVTLTFATFNEWVTQGEGIGKAFKLFEEATGNTIKQDIYPNDQFQTLLSAKLATGDVPDFYAMNMGEQYIPYTYLEPLQGDWVDKMVPAAKKLATRKEDGKVCMAYFSLVSYLCAIYNKDVFNKAGVKVPLMTYKDLLSACDAIQKTGVTPIFLMGKEAWTAEMIAGLGGVYVFKKDPALADKLKKNEIKPSESPAIVDLVKRALALKPYVNKDFMSVPLTAGVDQVVEGKCAMTFLGDWYYDEVAKKYPDKVANTGIMPYTLGDDYISAISSFNGRAFAVPKAAKHKAQALEAVDFLMQPENFKVLIAPFKGGSPYEGYEVDMNQWQKEMGDMIKQNNIPITDSYLSETGQFAWGAGYQVYQDVFAGKDVTKALDDWYKDYDKLNKAKKTPGF